MSYPLLVVAMDIGLKALQPVKTLVQGGREGCLLDIVCCCGRVHQIHCKHGMAGKPC